MLVQIRVRDGCTEGHGRWNLSSNETYRFVYFNCIISWLYGFTKLVKSSVSVFLLNNRPDQASLLLYTWDIWFGLKLKSIFLSEIDVLKACMPQMCRDLLQEVFVCKWQFVYWHGLLVASQWVHEYLSYKI